MAEKNSIPLIYAITKDSLITQQNQKNALESKASTLIGFAGGMIALLLSAMETIKGMQPIARYSVFFSIVLFIGSILLATIVGWVRKYRTDPNPSMLAKNYIDKSEQDVQLQLISNLNTAWENNFRQLESNAVILRVALLAQITAFIMLGLVLISFLL